MATRSSKIEEVSLPDYTNKGTFGKSLTSDYTFCHHWVRDIIVENRQDILDRVMNVIGRVFHGVDRKETADHLFGPDDQMDRQGVILAYARNRLIGFSSYRPLLWKGVQTVFRVGTVVDPDHQGLGLYQELVRRVQANSKLMVLTTQNPRVYHGVVRSSQFRMVYPRLDELTPPLFAEIAEQLLQSGGSPGKIERKTMVIRDRYPTPLYFSRPVASDLAVNEFFNRHVGDRDAVVVLGIV